MAATQAQGWAALATPKIIKSYFFGAAVVTDWKPGSPITRTGDYKGKPFQDKGLIKSVEVNRRLSMTHWSPLSGLPDVPENDHTENDHTENDHTENDHTVTCDLAADGNGTKVTLPQSNVTWATAEQAKKCWGPVLAGIKAAVAG
jgi:uncharacterized protein YndB with AHSA1/START domain